MKYFIYITSILLIRVSILELINDYAHNVLSIMTTILSVVNATLNGQRRAIHFPDYLFDPIRNPNTKHSDFVYLKFTLRNSLKTVVRVRLAYFSNRVVKNEY